MLKLPFFTAGSFTQVERVDVQSLLFWLTLETLVSASMPTVKFYKNVNLKELLNWVWMQFKHLNSMYTKKT